MSCQRIAIEQNAAAVMNRNFSLIDSILGLDDDHDETQEMTMQPNAREMGNNEAQHDEREMSPAAAPSQQTTTGDSTNESTSEERVVQQHSRPQTRFEREAPDNDPRRAWQAIAGGKNKSRKRQVQGGAQQQVPRRRRSSGNAGFLRKYDLHNLDLFNPDNCKNAARSHSLSSRNG